MEKLRNHIEEFLKQSSMKRVDMAKEMSVAPSVITRLLNDEDYSLTLDMAIKLSKFMNIEFLSIIKLAYPDEITEDLQISPTAEMIAREFDKLSPEFQKSILAIFFTAK